MSVLLLPLSLCPPPPSLPYLLPPLPLSLSVIEAHQLLPFFFYLSVDLLMIFSDIGSMKGGNFDEGNKGFFQQHQLQQVFHQRNFSQKRECNSDDVEAESRSTGGEDSLPTMPVQSPTDPKKQKTKPSATSRGGDEAGSIEVVRRPRGRPPGSKNKPKPPVVTNKDAGENSDVAATMWPHVLEIQGGHDVCESLARFSFRREVGVSVLSGRGSVSNVTIRQPSAAGGTTVTFHGRFEILSISATFFPPSFSASSPALMSGGMSISIAGPQGQILGGSVSGPLVAAGIVTVVAATFSKPTFHKLPIQEDQSVSISGDGGGDSGDTEPTHHQQQHHHHRGVSGPGSFLPSMSLSGSAGMSIYSGGHLPNDVVWTPTARAPPPPPPY